MEKRIAGVFPVVSTPFDTSGAMLPDELAGLIRYCAEAGAHGVVYPAIASEFATLTPDERRQASRTVMETARDVGIQAIIGVSSDTPQESRALAEMARTGGAVGAMLMVPKAAGQAADDVATFVRAATDGLNGIEIVLQNAPPPLGSSLPTEVLARALSMVPWVHYVKEEILPCGQRMTRLMNSLGDGLKGILGGAGGRFVLDEYARGACGTMPSCEMVELHRVIWDMTRTEREDTAREVFRQMLPLLDMAAVFRQSVVKEVLFARGLISSTRIRDENPDLDDQDRAEVARLLSDVLPLIQETRKQVSTVK